MVGQAVACQDFTDPGLPLAQDFDRLSLVNGMLYKCIALIERGYRFLAQQQQLLSEIDRLKVMKSIVHAKLKNFLRFSNAGKHH